MKTEDGILFYINHDQPVILLLTALHSLEKVYDGNIHVVTGDNPPSYFIDELKKHGRVTVSAVKKRWYTFVKEFDSHHKTRIGEWINKPYVMLNESPFARTLYFDCDHVFYEFAPELFDDITAHGFIIPAAEQTSRRKKRQSRLMPLLYDREKPWAEWQAINGGMIGFNGESSPFREWICNIATIMETHDGGYEVELGDESGLVAMINAGRGRVIDRNYSLVYPVKKELSAVPPGVMSIHFAAYRYCRHSLWKNEYMQAYNENYLNLRDYLPRCITYNRPFQRLLKYERLPTT